MTNQIPRARILAAGCSETGLCLNALPSRGLGILLDIEPFFISVALGVRAQVSPHTCRCGRKRDALGLHGWNIVLWNYMTDPSPVAYSKAIIFLVTAQ